ESTHLPLPLRQGIRGGPCQSFHFIFTIIDRMNQTTISFLQRIQHEAHQNGYTSLDLPQHQGVVVLSQEYSVQEQIQLLRQLLVNLEPAPPTPQAVANVNASAHHDCQVTVEERTQLFKFLSSS
nr:hypothetical protein [Spirochaetales bacterium]